MSKGLEALDKLVNHINLLNHINGVEQQEVAFEPLVNKNKSIIEKELKDYEQLKEDYEILKESYDAQCFSKDTIDNLRTLCDKLQKVLGIIKSKYVDLWLLSHYKSWNAYRNAHMNCSKTPLTKEEYEIVNRWFYGH